MRDTRGAEVSDEQIRKDVRSELEWDPRIASGGVGVVVDHGIVTLSGQVQSYRDRWAAEEAAQRVRGCRAVANELEVQLASGSHRSDSEIAAAAVRALESIAGLDIDDIHVSVTDGIIVLRGSVDEVFERQDAELAVRDLWGVRGVTNLIAVRDQVH